VRQDGNTALMQAAVGGHLAAVELLLERGADANMQTAQGGTALMHASYRGHAQVVRRLLSSNASVRLLDAYDSTALMRAADRGHAEVVQVLLDLSSPLDRRFMLDAHSKYDGFTALMRAAIQGHAECVQIIAGFGASLQVTNAAGQNVLTVARESNQAKVLEVLMRLGAVE
jgi:ankyrin repeat protein